MSAERKATETALREECEDRARRMAEVGVLRGVIAVAAGAIVDALPRHAGGLSIEKDPHKACYESINDAAPTLGELLEFAKRVDDAEARA